MSEHTPGPWYFGDGYIRRASKGKFRERADRIAQPSLTFKDSITYMANGNLIAASPDLYDFACRVASECLDARFVEQAMAVVAKAEGRD